MSRHHHPEHGQYGHKAFCKTCFCEGNEPHCPKVHACPTPIYWQPIPKARTV